MADTGINLRKYRHPRQLKKDPGDLSLPTFYTDRELLERGRGAQMNVVQS